MKIEYGIYSTEFIIGDDKRKCSKCESTLPHREFFRAENVGWTLKAISYGVEIDLYCSKCSPLYNDLKVKELI